MKKIYLPVIVAFLVLFIESCEDIVVSDNNIKKTAVNYGHDLANQESSVIMPLKVGNVWYYKVWNINEYGYCSGNYLDSIKVLNEIMIENERWFEVYYPILTNEYNVLMTNTDKGLWVKCDECEIKSFLWAKYPEIGGLYESGKREFKITDNMGNIIDQQVVPIGKISSKSSIRFSNSGTLETIKYEVYMVNGSDMIIENHLMNEYFKPDFGLVKYENIYKPGYKAKIYQNVDLQNYGKVDTNECRNNPRINLGQIKSGVLQRINYSIVNSFDEVIFFSDADILVVQDNNDHNNTIGMESLIQWRRLRPSEAMDIELFVLPYRVGAFSATIFISCQLGCWYSINLVGECVP